MVMMTSLVPEIARRNQESLHNLTCDGPHQNGHRNHCKRGILKEATKLMVQILQKPDQEVQR